MAVGRSHGLQKVRANEKYQLAQHALRITLNRAKNALRVITLNRAKYALRVITLNRAKYALRVTSRKLKLDLDCRRITLELTGVSSTSHF